MPRTTAITKEMFPADEVARFWSYVRHDRKAASDDACWPYTGGSAIAKRTYGSFWSQENGRAFPAHRVAYALENGPCPAELAVKHTCQYRPCCRPTHLVADVELTAEEEQRLLRALDTRR